MSGGVESIPITGPEHQKEYYPYFDWLRGLLAVIVMLAHDGVIPWVTAAYLAVQVFFALSGWLIGGILLDLPPSGLPRFYFNRVARIWGPYYAALAVLVAVSLSRDPITPKWSEFVFYKTTFVYNIFGPPQLAAHRYEMPLNGSGNHFWSVNVEEQFYLVAPLLLVIAAPIAGRSVTTWIVISLLAWYFNAYASIALGVAAAVAAAKFGPIHLKPLSRFILAFVTVGTLPGIAADWHVATLAPPFSIAVVLLLATLGRPSRLGAVVGGLSYPLYLNHWTGPFVAHAALKPFGLRDSAVAHVLSITFATCFSYGMYRVVDRPLLKHRSQYFTPARGWAAMILAYGLVIIGLIIGFWITRFDAA
jgi:peptidoglycan/LPS O-acetylase OafA/YrhL